MTDYIKQVAEAVKERAIELVNEWAMLHVVEDTAPHQVGVELVKYLDLDAIIASVPAPEPVNIDELVNRFLGWKLPKSFGPDAGISFKPPENPDWWPVGTNLFTAIEARQMLEYLLEGYAAPVGVSVPDGWQQELLDWVSACQSAYHIDNTPGHRFGGLGGNLEENRVAVVEYVADLLAAATGNQK